MLRLRPSLPAACLLGLVVLVPGGAGAHSVALVVGNSGYTALPKLTNPTHDAEAVADRLRQLGFQVIEIEDAKAATLEASVRQFQADAAGADAALFYFAGHGVQVGGANYLLPVDASVANVADLTTQAFDVTEIVQALHDAHPDAAVVILDACRDNPLPDRVATDGSASTALTSGLARVEGASGLLIAYSTAPGQVAFDGSGANSPFAAALVQQLAEPGLEVSQLFRQVRQRVMEMTGGAQIPWVEEALLQPLYLHPTDVTVAADDVTTLNAALAGSDDPTIQLAAVATLASTTEDETLRPVLDERIARLQAVRYQGLAAQAASPAKTLADWMIVQLLAETPGGPLAATAFLVLHPGSGFTAEAQALASANTASRGLRLGEPEQIRLWSLVEPTEDPQLIDSFLELVPSGEVAERAKAAQQILALGAAGPPSGTPADATAPAGDPNMVTVFVGTGPAAVPLPSSPADIVIRTLPGQGSLTAELPDGSRQDLTEQAIDQPLKVSALLYTPNPAAREVVDSFALAPGGSRGLALGPAEPAVAQPDEAIQKTALTIHADVRVHDCDRLAGARFDTQGVVIGNYPNEIDPAQAIPACRQAVEAYPDVPRFKFELARALAADGQHDAAFPLYLEAGEAGHAIALYAIGYAYQNGFGVAADADRALEYYRAGLDYGDLYAANSLGIAYRDGIGVPRDPQRAEQYFIQAASGGHTFAYNNLGTMYLEGDGVAANPEAAYRLFQASADAGDIYGYNNMGVLYDRGVYVPADPAAAVTWYEKAAAGGQPQAPVNLGLMYLGGHGLDADGRQAAYWFAEAARLGNAWGYTNLGWMYQSGEAIAADPVQAAEMYGRAVALGSGDAVAQARQNFAQLPRAVAVRDIQTRLAARGQDVGPIDGQWGRKTATAARAFLTERQSEADATDILAVLGALVVADDAS